MDCILEREGVDFELTCERSFSPSNNLSTYGPGKNNLSADKYFVLNLYNKNVGVDDFAAFNKILAEWTEVKMNNAIAAREVWIVENTDNKKMLVDITFKKYVTQHKENVKEVNKFFAMGFTPDVEQALDATLNDKKTRKNVKSVVPDGGFTCDPDEINNGFCFYHDNFKANIFFIVCEKCSPCHEHLLPRECNFTDLYFIVDDVFLFMILLRRLSCP